MPGDSVIAGQHHQPHPLERPRRADALAGGHPGAELLQPSQGPVRLGEGGELPPGLLADVAVGWADGHVSG